MRTRKTIARLLLFIIIIISITCDDNGDSDDDNDNSPPDDDILDDDLTTDDDTSDDDSQDSAEPILVNAYWEPNPTELGGCGGPDAWCSYLVIFICDPTNDLLPDGEMYFYPNGQEPPWGPLQFMLDELFVWPGYSLDEASDCSDPVKIGFVGDFGTTYVLPAGNYCTDVEAMDSAGNFSNKLADVCVVHNPVQN